VEHAEPELERTVRRVRRALWAFRLVFYPGAAVIALLLLSGSGSDAVSSTWLGGSTEQRERFTMRLDDDRPGYFHTNVVGTCADGYRWTQRWFMGDGAPESPFAFDGRMLSVTKATDMPYSNGQTGRLTMRLRARVEDDSVMGTVSLVTRLENPGGAPYVCESGSVGFTAHAR
jgi:hypothetical protein